MGESDPRRKEADFLSAISSYLQQDLQSGSTGPIGNDEAQFLARGRAVLSDERRKRLALRKARALEERMKCQREFDAIVVQVPSTIEQLRGLIESFARGLYGLELQVAAEGQFRKFESASKQDLMLIAEDLLKLKALKEKSDGLR